MRFVMLVALMGLVSCGAARDWVADQAKGQVELWAQTTGKAQMEGWIQEYVGPRFESWKEEADVDKSGDTSWAEWQSWLLSGAGGLGLLSWVVAKMRGQKAEVEAEAAKNSRKRGEQWEAMKAMSAEIQNLKLKSSV